MAKPNSLHLQIETCYIVDFSEGFSIQSTDVATFRSFIYTFFFPTVSLGGVCSVL